MAVILGHVDHGKSSILEAIWDLKITAKESGGITQHIGAYEVEHQANSPSSHQDGTTAERRKITFIDTPGHEAFSAMRSRGAKVADIAVLVVSAEEGVKEQTKEAVKHIKEADIPMIVAINKIDKPEANPEKVKRELANQDVLVESMGGKIPSVNVSAKTKAGINDLLDLILLIAEMENLQADISLPARGLIIEAYQDSKKGVVATAILEQGVLNIGDIVGTFFAFGKVKVLNNFQGKPMEKVTPSIPVIILGFESVPGVGENFNVFPDIETAKNNLKPVETNKLLQETPLEEGKKTLNLIIKADVQGSVEAIREVLKAIPQDKALLRVIKADVGEITENDLKLATSSRANVVGFRVKASASAKSLAEKQKIKIKTFDIIYELVQAVRTALEKIMEPEIVRLELGEAKVLAIFRTDKSRQIVGGKVAKGNIKRGASVEVLRNSEKIGKGKLIGLQRGKKDIEEVAKGTEFGTLYEGNVKLEEGDILQAYAEERRKVEL